MLIHFHLLRVKVIEIVTSIQNYDIINFVTRYNYNFRFSCFTTFKLDGQNVSEYAGCDMFSRYRFFFNLSIQILLINSVIELRD